MHPTYVAVCGASEATAEQEAAARAVGRTLAARDVVLVCGGLGGVMEAACRGAHEAGGLTIGILPGAERSAANRYVAVALPTGMGEMRNALIVRAADAVIAIGGGFGTLSEIALALRTGTPVVGFRSWDLGRPEIIVAEDPDAAVDLALKLASRG